MFHCVHKDCRKFKPKNVCDEHQLNKYRKQENEENKQNERGNAELSENNKEELCLRPKSTRIAKRTKESQ